MAFREPTPDERRLLRDLLDLAGYDESGEWLKALRVEEMADGGMGSLQLMNDTRGEQERTFGRRLASVEFIDADGVAVVASLNANTSGEPFELDMWKTDSSPLVKIADSFLPLED
jgi:hypothetical protein